MIRKSPSQENTCDGLSLCLQLYWKVIPIQMFSCESWKIFKNNYFVKHLRTNVFFDSVNIFEVIRFYHILAVKRYITLLKRYFIKTCSFLIAFTWKAEHFVIAYFFFFSPRLFRNIREFGAKKYFTDHWAANIIKLFVAINRNFSGKFFFWTAKRNFPETFW